HFEPGRPVPSSPVRNDLAEYLDFRAVDRSFGTICAAFQHQALTVQAKPVIAIVIDPAFCPVLSDGLRTAGNGVEARQGPTDTRDAVATAAAVSKSQAGLHPPCPRRDWKRN